MPTYINRFWGHDQCGVQSGLPSCFLLYGILEQYLCGNMHQLLWFVIVALSNNYNNANFTIQAVTLLIKAEC